MPEVVYYGQENIRAVQNWSSRFIDLFLHTATHRAAAVEWKEIPKDQFFLQEPIARLRTTEAQQLMDDLWAAGVRPTEGAGSAGAMSATQEHLKDLRRMLFEDDRTRQQSLQIESHPNPLKPNPFETLYGNPKP